MIDPKQVSGVIVTKGDADLTPILERLKCLGEVIVYDNSIELDRKVSGRYVGISRAKHDFAYVQDDDCLIDVERLCAEYKPGELLCNMLPSHQPFYKSLDMALVGWGALFPRYLTDFSEYLAKWPADELFHRECDRVFTWLNKFRVIDIGVQHLPHALGRDRMGTEPRHGDDLREIQRRLKAL
jgi:hypothetical protein